VHVKNTMSANTVGRPCVSSGLIYNLSMMMPTSSNRLKPDITTPSSAERRNGAIEKLRNMLSQRLASLAAVYPERPCFRWRCSTSICPIFPVLRRIKPSM